ncbi:MAG TPA: SRPBCC family protein [Actinocrinis sp.]|nr:SRPBCC family protein [Actinocrinis sp.]
MPDSAQGAGYICVSVHIMAPAQAVWEATTDWERQSAWMLGTRVRGTEANGQGVGGGIEAWTGVGPLGFLDTMVITEWDPPHRCAVKHTGRLIKGTGAFEVTEHKDGGCILSWSEDLTLPLGALGRLGWPVAKPFTKFGLERSLAKLKAAVTAEQS